MSEMHKRGSIFKNTVDAKTIKLFAIILILLLAFPLLSQIQPIKAEATTLFFDDFESYEAGTFPSAGGWELVWDGMGSKYQVVTSDHYHSPSKSFQLLGSYGWSSVAERRFSTTAMVIGFEAYIMAKEYTHYNVKGVGSIGFWNREEATWGKYYVTVAFMGDGYLAVTFIDASGDNKVIELQPYTPGTWYKVKVVLDRSTNTLSVWINDELKASNLKTTSTNNINALEVSSAWAEVRCYFDDIKVFTTSSATPQTIPPTLTLYDPQVNGLTVTVNGNVAPGYSGASISRVHWDWGDGSGGDYSFPASHTYSKPGTYNVTVTVYQSDGLTTSKTITVTLQALNRPPVADFSYSPPSPLAGEAVSFTDKSYDPDGSIVYWHWDFGDGAASSERNPSHVYTSPGTYTVTLKVRDDKGAESSTSKTIKVKASQLSAEIKPIGFKDPLKPCVYEKPYEVTFEINIIKALPGNYNGRILIADPTLTIVGDIKFSVNLKGSEEHITEKWKAPEDSKPGTYSALLVLEGEGGKTANRTLFYFEDPDKSYIEVLPLGREGKMIHFHLQRFRWLYLNKVPPPIDYVTAMKLFKLDLVGVSIRVIQKLVSAGKSAVKGVVTPTEPYDLTIIPIYRIGEGYLCLISESHPVGIVPKEALDFVIKEGVKTIFGFFLEEFGVSIPSVPIPLEHFMYISKEDYESFTIDKYTPLTLPTEVKVKFLEENAFTDSLTVKVQIIDPRTNKPLNLGNEFWAITCISPITAGTEATPICVHPVPIDVDVSNGIFTFFVNGYRVYPSATSEYIINFEFISPGYIGISSNSFSIHYDPNKEAQLYIPNLSFSISTNSILFSETTRIHLSFDAGALRILDQNINILPPSASVQVRILKKTFFGLFNTEIARRDAKIGHNDLEISLKGEDIADKFLFWSIPGNYDIYAEITVTYTPLGSRTPVSITRTTPILTVNVHS